MAELALLVLGCDEDEICVWCNTVVKGDTAVSKSRFGIAAVGKAVIDDND